MFYPLLSGFIIGAAAAIVYYKVRLKKLSKLLISKIDELNVAVTKDNNELLPAEFSDVISKLTVLTNRSNEKSKSIIQHTEESEKANRLQKAVDNLHIVNELGQNVTSSLNLQQTFQHLYTTINSMMDAAVLELSVYNEHAQSWKIYTNNNPSEAKDYFIHPNHVSEWCFKNNREVFLADAENDFGRYVFQPLVLQGEKMAKSIIAFPIHERNKVTGTLCIVSFQKNMFYEYHQEIIRLLLGYIGVAMQNAFTHEELNATKIRAEQGEKFKELFLANMSHEIRTPINAVTGMTRLLLAKEPRSDQFKYLESIKNASDSLLVIINDILDLSKIEAGKIELEQIDFSIQNVLKNVKDIMQFKAEEKGLLLNEKIEANVPQVLIGDPTRLTQILINLIGNAVKFTEKGSVQLTVSNLQLSRKPNDFTTTNCQLKFEISDTGIGMTTEQQQKLFQNYSQASAETTRKYGGTGLGLSISKQLVELHGGFILVKSEIGKGSTFSFLITYAVSDKKTIAIKKNAVSDEMLQKLKGIRILLADDNEYNRIVVRDTLQLKIADIKVDEALDGEQAIDLLKKNDYDVILMDLIMPNTDGIDAAKIIRSEFSSPKNKIKIIALTASVIQSEIDKSIAAGMNGFIPKPFKPNQLYVGIYNALHKDSVSVSEETVNKTITIKPSGNYIDLNYLLEFTEGDEIRMKRYIDLFLNKTPVSISILKMACTEGDYEKIRITAHSIKPQLRFTGVMQGLELAEKIELNCFDKTNLDELTGLIDQLALIAEKALAEMQQYKVT